jgi:tripartite-type tricarboxylate transporter receptor subunit TctC
MTTSSLTNGRMPRRRVLIAGAAAAASAVCNSASLGQTAPWAKQERLRILCTGPAGSVPDIIARTFGEALAGVFAEHVVVDNRPGAAGQIAVQALKSAPADGSTWLLGQGAIASLYPTLYGKLGYDPARDLVPVSLAAEMNLGVAVGNAVPAEVADTRMLVEWMRRHPGEANAASPGTGTLPHILEVMLFDHARLDWRHVPYPGGTPARIAEQASQAIGNVAARTGLARRFEDAAMTATQSSPAQLAAKIEDDRRAWAPLLVDARIRGDA